MNKELVIGIFEKLDTKECGVYTIAKEVPDGGWSVYACRPESKFGEPIFPIWFGTSTHRLVSSTTVKV